MRNNPTQADRILELLEAAPFDPHHPGGPGKWVSLSQIVRLGIAQYNARIKELRAALALKGMTVENFWQWSDARNCRVSWYRLAVIGQKPATPAEVKP